MDEEEKNLKSIFSSIFIFIIIMIIIFMVVVIYTAPKPEIYEGKLLDIEHGYFFLIQNDWFNLIFENKTIVIQRTNDNYTLKGAYIIASEAIGKRVLVEYQGIKLQGFYVYVEDL